MEEYILKRKKIILFLTFTFGLLFMIGSPNQASAATHSLRVAASETGTAQTKELAL